MKNFKKAIYKITKALFKALRVVLESIALVNGILASFGERVYEVVDDVVIRTEVKLEYIQMENEPHE